MVKPNAITLLFSQKLNESLKAYNLSLVCSISKLKNAFSISLIGLSVYVFKLEFSSGSKSANIYLHAYFLTATEDTRSGRSSGARSRNFSTTSLSLDEQVEILEEQVALVQAQYTGVMRKVKVKNLKRELFSLKKQQKNEQKKARNSGDEKAVTYTTQKSLL